MEDKRPRIIDVVRKPVKCPVCGERVVDIIYGTGDGCVCKSAKAKEV